MKKRDGANEIINEIGANAIAVHEYHEPDHEKTGLIKLYTWLWPFEEHFQSQHSWIFRHSVEP